MTTRPIRSLVARTRKTLLWNRAIDAYHSHRTTESIALVHKMGEIGPLQPYHLAFLGTAYILSKDTLKARKYLREAESITEGSSDPSARYVNAYAKIYLKMMDTDLPVDDLIYDAVAINCRPSLKRWLPLEIAKKS